MYTLKETRAMKKIVLILFVFILINSSLKADFYGNLDKRDNAGEQDIDKTYDRLSYPPLSKMLFQAYLHQENDDKKEINNILKNGYRDASYLLQKAFRYGAKKLYKPMPFFKRTKVITAMWEISQDFLQEANRSSHLWPIVMWSSISIASFIAGSYAQRQFEAWDDISGLISNCSI